ncbi:aminopeptidase [Rhodothalassium salexigens]|uniref:M1 family metallopeptidase n=1 Tax=Rhodothalassium salexigens TaxID=1086 RepID=UPI001914903A|nr:M1 family metallopeptidase [Rhodothalassium salexigens]MBK5912082.1 aminopeptidase [Rhodothalassium salexigens]
MRLSALFAAALCLSALPASAQIEQTKSGHTDKFRQLDEILPTPNVYRTGSGAPGHEYWQQKVDYEIDVTLDAEDRRLSGVEAITYHNQSPDTLRYLWVQLDQQRFAKHSDAYATLTAGKNQAEKMAFRSLRARLAQMDHDGGHKIASVADADGNPLAYTITDTMMRIDLPAPLAPGATVDFTIDWSYNIPEAKVLGARGGWEFYEDDGNHVYFIAQWFPRLAAYTDDAGWNTKQFLGGGEFTLEFGDYDVEITVPADHVVASTGTLQNPGDVLNRRQRQRLERAREADEPIFIITPEEAKENQKSKARGTRTWHFTADNVRDFAFASSRKFVWDAAGFTFNQDTETPDDDRTVLAMSFYPEEGMPLWDKYSTHSILHTLDTYSRYSFEYPYPVAQSVMGPIGGGMEYPMITSNGPRPEIDEETGERSYSRRTKYGLISVIIHEIGHIYFPMTVNTDERNWTWMDEGINSFLQTLAEQEWEEDYPSRRGAPEKIVDYMVSPNQVPIMTQSDSILQFGNNAYGKPAIALNILRETIVGRELFDFAFKEYARRWKFKRPQPADLFRSLEDASGRDLDWFWRGWFYTTDHVDIALTGVTRATLSTQDPDVEKPRQRAEEAAKAPTIMAKRNAEAAIDYRVDRFPELKDFYNENDRFTVTPKDRKSYEGMVDGLEEWQKEMLALGANLYFLDFENIGGLVMPILLDITYADGSTEELRIPAEIWRRNQNEVTKLLIRDKEIAKIQLDPHRETADADTTNNVWPAEPVKTRLELFKYKSRPNLMQEMRDGGDDDTSEEAGGDE